MDTKDSIGERGRSLEDNYFRRRDRELLEQVRDQEAVADRRRPLAAALGIDDDAIVTALSAFGFDAATVPLVDIVPAIQVAWADGHLSAGERKKIERLLASPEMQSSGRLGSRLVAGWLAEEPSGEFYRVTTAVLRHHLARIDAGTRTRVVRQMEGDCTAVAGGERRPARLRRTVERRIGTYPRSAAGAWCRILNRERSREWLHPTSEMLVANDLDV